VLLPILLALVVVHAGGFGALAEQLRFKHAELMSPVSLRGWETALALMLAIVGANLFNQGYWQRVWVCRTDEDLRRAFLIAGLVTVPAIFVAGSFGLIAQGAGVLSEPSAALFDLVAGLAMPVVALAVLVLAVALVMSSMDTLLSALVSLFAVDAARLRPGLSAARLLAISRWLTFVPALLAGLIALQGYSVLYLFLLADLICVAAAVPTFYGLFEARLSGRMALIAALLGLVAGGFLFPDPTFARGNLVPELRARGIGAWADLFAVRAPRRGLLVRRIAATGRPTGFVRRRISARYVVAGDACRRISCSSGGG
jgi:Na+/proline symporter